MDQQGVHFVISNTTYTIKADVDRAILQNAVDDLNTRIQEYKKKTNKDELRATVLAALSIAAERDSANIEKLELELVEYKDRLSELIKKLDTSLGEL